MLGVLGTSALITFVVPDIWYEPTIALTLGSALLVILWLRPSFSLHPVSPLVFWLHLGSHMYFIVAGLLSGVIFNPPFLLIVSSMMAMVMLYLHHSTVLSWLLSLSKAKRVK